MAYQVLFSTRVLGQSLMRAGLASQPTRARATVALHCTFLLSVGLQVAGGAPPGSA